MTKERLQQLEALEQAATKGPWEVQDASNPDEDEPCYREIRGWTDESSDGTYLKLSVDDAAFVAESRTALPELIAEVRRLKAENSDMAQLFNFLGPYIQWQRIGAAIAISPDEHAAYMKYLRPILKAES